MATHETIRHDEPARVPLLNDPRIRGLIYQILVFTALVIFIYWIVGNTLENLRRANIASGFGFLRGRAGFDISQTLIQYSSDSTFARALVVGLLNTLLIAVTGIVTASIVGFLVGIGRLSKNWLIRKICTVYVEVFRNIPPLLVIFFWYLGVLSVLPLPRDSIALPFDSYLNSRGFFLPRTVWEPGSWLLLVGLALGVAMAWFVARRARIRQMATGQQFPVLWTSIGLIVGLPLLAFVAAGFPLSIEYPQKGTFNLTGGFQIKPEFIALYLALSFYTASFIAEIVRAGILGVSKGQTEASLALGLRPRQALRLVIVPQALRIIIPPLTSQYLNLTKNSSLAIAVGYADLVAVGGTILNQTGQSIEVVAIWMVVYLGLSLLTSAFMNWFNARMALVER
ncbi:amino acid ABC transporter permease [Mesorhizobium sp. 1B3]|uniref:amino acid ABC transporter permease n=1 Tax=Mesorhizobium sp. 1B3 TaxID=3243599 RepID=UPI003D98A86D